MPGIPLAAAIAELRREVTKAIDDARGEALQFRLGPIELELQVELSREGGGSGKIQAWVVELGAEGKLARADTHTVKLTLEPVLIDPEGEPEDVKVGRRQGRAPMVE